MRIAGFEIRRYAKSERPSTVESGRSRDPALLHELEAGGPDENPELSGLLKYHVYDSMRKSDPAVRSLLWMLKLPIRHARIVVDSVSDDPMDKRIADACAWQLGLEDHDGPLDRTWSQTLATWLLALDYGCWFEEKVWAKGTRSFVDADGDEQIVVPITRLGRRPPKTIQKISTDRDGKITSVEQNISRTSPMPGDRVVHHVLDPDGDGTPWGTSLLRPAWGAWKMKRQVLIESAIGWDRYAFGTPVVWTPANATPADKAKAEEIGQDFRAHERGYLVLEGPRDKASVNGWDVDVLGGEGSMADPVPLIRTYDQMIAQSGIQQFASLGSTETGSRAVADVLIEPFYMAVEAVVGDVLDVARRQILRDFVDVNFGREFKAPRLRATKIQRYNIVQIADAISGLSSAGFNFADRGTQDDIRDQMRLRKLPELEEQLELLPDEVGIAQEGGGLVRRTV